MAKSTEGVTLYKIKNAPGYWRFLGMSVAKRDMCLMENVDTGIERWVNVYDIWKEES